MYLNTIRFNNRHALSIRVQQSAELDAAIKTLGLESPRPVIVLIGGAGLVKPEEQAAIQAATQQLAAAAEQFGAVVIDGGTRSGVMAAVGQARAEAGYRFPLIGVATEATVTWLGRVPGWQRRFRDRGRGTLDPNHTHFILVPGSEWGDESSWIAQAASQLAGQLPSVAVLMNCGDITLNADLPNNLHAGRQVLVVDGTGRAADQLAAEPPADDQVQIVRQDTLYQALQSILVTS